MPNKINILSEYAELIIESFKYGSFTVLIDKEDIEKIKLYNWSINNKKCGCYVETYNIKTSQKMYLHRFITNAPENKVVDHINRITLDNRKENLRIVDKSINAINSKLSIKNTSGHKNITWNKQVNKWQVGIKRNYKYKFYGLFKNINDAVKKRDEILATL